MKENFASFFFFFFKQCPTVLTEQNELLITGTCKRTAIYIRALIAKQRHSKQDKHVSVNENLRLQPFSFCQEVSSTSGNSREALDEPSTDSWTYTERVAPAT